MNLNDLRKQRETLDEQIKTLEADEEEQTRRHIIEGFYVKGVCCECHGDGTVWVGGHDILTDPPTQDTCKLCSGDGFVYVQRWTGKRKYDLKYDGRNKGWFDA